MAMIQVSGLTFAYAGSYDNIFEDVSFQVDTDWKLGFIGRNGRGKTTFLRLLMGAYPYQGNISASVQFDYFPPDVADDTLDTWEVVDQVCGCELWELQRELNLLEVDDGVLYRPFDTLSGGEQGKVLLAAMFLKEGNFPLIDEPTNHLDTHARQVLAAYLKKSRKGFILVSHDRAFVDACVDHVLSINRAGIEVQQGNFSSWKMNRDRQDGFERVQDDKLRKDIKRLEAASRRTANWSDKVEKSKKGQKVAGLKPDRGHVGAMAAKMMKRSKVTEAHRERAVEEKGKLLKNVEESDVLFLRPLRHHSDLLVRAEDLSVAYGGRTVFEGLSFTVRRDARVALAGRNGCGKSSVLKLIAGEDGIEHTGVLQLASGLKISYVPQDTSFLRGGLDDFIVESGADMSLFKAILRKLDFARVQFEKDMAGYSAGQKKKVLLARSFCTEAHLYVWDEPLNYIDVLSRMQVEEAILRSDATMLFVEHDIAFVEDVATKVVEIV